MSGCEEGEQRLVDIESHLESLSNQLRAERKQRIQAQISLVATLIECGDFAQLKKCLTTLQDAERHINSTPAAGGA